MPLQDAIYQAHYPADATIGQAARRRLAFDELLMLQLAALARRHHWEQGVQGVPIKPDTRVLEGFLASLPFQLTGAQRRCLGEILGDMKRGTPAMTRLLQGEVGSGKTVVVLAALLAAVAAGYQGAIMVPTEVLAEQHFQTVSRLLGGLARPMEEDHLFSVYLDLLRRPVSVGLLTGSTRQGRKQELTQMAAAGDLDILIGTHALIQSGVTMPRLALAVADEQHRFGVMQRSALRQKGSEIPHTLVISATPIPRTLSLTLYGDLDISTIDELPPGRQQVLTRWLPPERREAAYAFVRKEVQAGRQAFVICPLVDDSEAVEARAATEEYKHLSQQIFPDLRLGLLHGRMSSRDKDQVMRQFRDGELDLLVSTAVVEVGIDVANATVMLIEGADRFGLAQLHQFRGRVGRGQHKSYCLLLSDSPSEMAWERLLALERVHDGFQLAEVDLELRGPGDFFGTRQSGLPGLRIAQLSDRALLDLARQEAIRLMEQDPELAAPAHASLAAQVARFLSRVSAEVS
jgi:ATP-dependent DNA helicase RecG